jgi:MoxR-like ATPase
VNRILDTEHILASRQAVDGIYVDDKVKDYIVELVLATRDPKAHQLNLEGYIQFGASPRATINLTLAAKAWAFLQGRGYVTPQDVKSIAPEVLRHRVIVSYEAEAENLTSEDIIRRILDAVPVP